MVFRGAKLYNAAERRCSCSSSGRNEENSGQGVQEKTEGKNETNGPIKNSKVIIIRFINLFSIL